MATGNLARLATRLDGSDNLNSRVFCRAIRSLERDSGSRDRFGVAINNSESVARRPVILITQ